MLSSRKLPSNPNLRQLRNQAKDLHKAQKAGDPSALRRIGESHPRFSGLSEAEIAAAEFVLADAQLVIARELGFSSWPKLKSHVQSLSSPASSTQAIAIGNKEQARATAEIENLGGRCKIDSSGQVRTVSLSGQKFTNAVTEYLKGLTSLKELYLVKTQIGDNGLLHLKGLTALKRFYVSGKQVTDAGLEHLKGLVNLERLYLGKTHVSDDGLVHLKSLTNLRELYLNRTRLSGDGLKHLKELTGLESLGLDRTKVSDADLAHLKGLISLERLYLSGTQVTDAGLVHLKGLAGLRKLDLRFTPVTDTGNKKLKQALPDCKIYL